MTRRASFTRALVLVSNSFMIWNDFSHHFEPRCLYTKTSKVLEFWTDYPDFRVFWICLVTVDVSLRVDQWVLLPC